MFHLFCAQTASATSGVNGVGSASASPSLPTTFAQPRKRPSDAALDAVAKKLRMRDASDAVRQLDVRKITSSSLSLLFLFPFCS